MLCVFGRKTRGKLVGQDYTSKIIGVYLYQKPLATMIYQEEGKKLVDLENRIKLLKPKDSSSKSRVIKSPRFKSQRKRIKKER